jgi:hypothetical protein
MVLDSRQAQHKRITLITKEFLVGFLCLGLGAYNLLAFYKVISWSYTVPQLIGNILLVVGGFLLVVTAFKVWKYKFHSRGLF